MTRRALLARTALAGLAIGLAACTPTATPAGTSAPAAASRTPGPRRGGTLTWGQWDKNDDIDPSDPSGASGTEIIGNIVDTLVSVDETGKVFPALATKWEMADEGRKFTFTLRDGVTFHDGTPFAADSVKRSWERILDPKQKSSNAPVLGPVDRIDAPDPRTLVVTFKDPNPLFLLAIWRPWFGPLSPKQLDRVKPGDKIPDPIGTGPYKFGAKSADGVYTLQANAAYAWAPESLKNRGAPYLDSIRFRSIPEAGTRTATLESGENLLVDELSETDWSRLKDDKRFSFVLAPRRGLGVGLTFNVQQPPTDDLAVRQAINWAVDRQGIVDKLYFGVHRVNVGPLGQGVWGRLDDLERAYTFDQAKAKKVLDDAGWVAGTDGIRQKGGKRLALAAVVYLSPWIEMATAVQSQLRAVGIDMQLQKMERAPYLDFVRAYKHNICQSAGTNFDPDELRIRYQGSAIKSANFANLADTQLDGLLVKGSRQAVGSDERRKTYEDAQRRLMDLLPFVSIMTQVRIEAMSARIHDLRMGPTGLNGLPMNDTWMDA
jgi:peptide/nickel transport system substrate-binding protein